ncbi:protein Mis18-beta isoform X1 [Danio rerio]|uniref:Opa-interacting protein 5 n=2 Tax=Danio rerio TaxID=7955 RepID=B8A4N0_DANRE|nr:protein Mis18-beta [Danio rerio]|eukprot:NP_001139092.1 opa interacting protein 5 [Danio rerio]
MANSTRSLLESSYDIGPCDSTQSSSIVEQLQAVKDKEICMVDFRNCIVFQCITCNTVLGDSLGVCGEVESSQSVICLKVTEDVMVNEKHEMCSSGQLASSTYQTLLCTGCHDAVGLVLHSTPKHLSALRNLFLLRKELINCYILRSGTCVKASKINFKHRLMDKNIKKLKEYLETKLKQVDILEQMMEKMCTHDVN